MVLMLFYLCYNKVNDFHNILYVELVFILDIVCGKSKNQIQLCGGNYERI